MLVKVFSALSVRHLAEEGVEHQLGVRTDFIRVRALLLLDNRKHQPDHGPLFPRQISKQRLDRIQRLLPARETILGFDQDRVLNEHLVPGFQRGRQII